LKKLQFLSRFYYDPEMNDSGGDTFLQITKKCTSVFLCVLASVFFLVPVFPKLLFSNDTSAVYGHFEHELSGKSGKERVKYLLVFAGQIMLDDPGYGLILTTEAVNLAREIRVPLLLSDAWKLKADALFYLDSLPASAIAYIESAETDQQSGNPRADSILRRIGDAGHVYYRMGWFEKAIEYHNSALAMSRNQKDTAEIATNLFNLGLAYNLTGQYDKSVEHMLEAIDLDKLTNNTQHISTNYNALGMVYLSWGNTRKALEFLNLALEYDKKSGDESKMAIRLSNISKIFMTDNRLEEARQSLEHALEIDQRLNNTLRVAIRLQGLGLINYEMGDFETALGLLKQSLEIFKSFGLDYKIAGLKVQSGKVYQRMGEKSKAETSYLDGLALARQLNLRPEEMEATNSLFLLYKQQHDYARALQYFEKYKTLQDSVFSEKSAALINEFEVKYETEKKEQENQLLIKENAIRRRTQRLFLIVIIALIMLSLSLLWAFTLKRKSLLQSRILFEKESELSRLKIIASEKRNTHLQEMLFAEEKIKKLQAQTLEQKKQELTTSAMLIANKNEVFHKLKKLAGQIKEKFAGKGNDEVREIISEIDRQTDMENQWDEFKLHFESIHKLFFRRLKAKCPGVTQHDMQLCAYVKLNLNTKEIARLMNITPESVNTHRYRLRKKLALSAEETLDDFVHQL
jgi:tetratricopeptide (TPR) repeat protein/DNA-binding CsgD family transcriptional regulator